MLASRIGKNVGRIFQTQQNCSLFCGPKTRLTHTSLGMQDIKKIGVIGAGQMGTGIAKVAAQIAKKEVILMDVDSKKLSESIKFIDGLLKKDLAKNKTTEEESVATRKRISSTSDMKDLSKVDFIIEAATENPTLKEKIFKELSQIASPHAILATNTSSISITKIGAATNRPEKVIGMHFMNPVPVMKLVEIIPGYPTSD